MPTRTLAACHGATSIAVLLLGVARTARAQDGEPLHAALSVHSEGQPPCVAEADLAARVEDILGRDAIDDDAPRLRVEVLVRRGELTTHATVRLLEDGVVVDTREALHEGRRCRALIGPLSVVVAMLLDDRERARALDLTSAAGEDPAPLASTPTAEPPRTTLAAAAAPSEPPRTTLAAAPAPSEPPSAGGTSAPSAERGWNASFAIGAALAVGMLPGAAVGPELRGRAGPAGGFALTSSLTVLPWASSEGSPRGEFSGFVGALGACTPRATDARPLLLAGCAALGGGAIRGSGAAVAHAYERFEVWLAAETYLALDLLLGGPAALSLRAGLAVPLLRPAFYVRSGERNLTIHEPWSVVPVVALALALGDDE